MKMTPFPFLLFFVFLFSQKLMAASGSVPVVTVISQIANLSLLILILYFFTRKSISEAFAEKRRSFLESVEQASRSKQEAEAKLAEVQQRVNQLQSTFEQQIAEAKKNAEDSYRTQLADAKNEATRMQNMTTTSLEFEIQKQIENLRIETFKKSSGLAEQKLQSGMSPEQQKAWNGQFVEKNQGVH